MQPSKGANCERVAQNGAQPAIRGVFFFAKSVACASSVRHGPMLPSQGNSV